MEVVPGRPDTLEDHAVQRTINGMNGTLKQVSGILAETDAGDAARAHAIARYCLRRFAGEVLVLSATHRVLVMLSEAAHEWGRGVSRKVSPKERYCLLAAWAKDAAEVAQAARYVNGIIWLVSDAGSISVETLSCAGLPMLGWDAPLVLSPREALLARRDLP